MNEVEAICQMSPQQYLDSLENDLPNDEFQFDAIDFDELEGEVEQQRPNFTSATKQNTLFLEKQSGLMS